MIERFRLMTCDDIPFICEADRDESAGFVEYLRNNLDNQENKKCSALIDFVSCERVLNISLNFGLTHALGSLEMAYVCKIASLEEMERKWNAEILRNLDEKDNWVVWKAEAMEDAINRCSIPCYGILDDQIICEATAIILPGKPQNDEGLVDDQTAYLCAFRTMEEYRGQGFFSKLLNFLFENLRSQGFKRATVGVEVGDETNIQIYRHFGFVHYVKQGRETYPDGTEIDVRYYAKNLR